MHSENVWDYSHDPRGSLSAGARQWADSASKRVGCEGRKRDSLISTSPWCILHVVLGRCRRALWHSLYKAFVNVEFVDYDPSKGNLDRLPVHVRFYTSLTCDSQPGEQLLVHARIEVTFVRCISFSRSI